MTIARAHYVCVRITHKDLEHKNQTGNLKFSIVITKNYDYKYL